MRQIPSIPRTLIVFCFFMPFPLQSQEYRSGLPVVTEDLIEQMARDSEEELDYQTLLGDINDCLENPLEINSAGREELERLHLLTDFQISSLLNYIVEKGPLLTIYELPLVYGFDEGLARKMEPLVSFETTSPARGTDHAARPPHQLFLRFTSVLEEQKGYSPATDSLMETNPNARYLGGRLKVLTKYRFRYGRKLELGYTGEKDAGEPFLLGGNRYGFDYNSAYLRVNDVWKFSSIIAGDYQVRSGQGVILWSGLAFGKSPDIVNTRKKNTATVPYTSSDENRFMRGVSATFEHKGYSFTGFFSGKYIDANTFTDTLDGETCFSSFLVSGLHSLPREFEDKDAVKETIIGGTASRESGNFRAGITLLHHYYDAAYKKKVSADPFLYTGRSNTNAGLDYTYSGNRLVLFGEAGYSGNGSLAALNGACFDLHPQVKLSLLHRYFDKAFHALYGNAFTENTSNRNENGLYTGIEIFPLPDWKLSGYLDAYRFPFLQTQIGKPSAGFDCLFQADYSRKDGIAAYLRYKHKDKPENVSGDQTGLSLPETVKTSHLRFHVSYPVAGGLIFQDRLELSSWEQEPGSREGGFLAYHDVIYKPEKPRLSLYFRYCMFDTESYNSRIYTYENDVLYAYSIPFHYGQGIRTYLNVRWEIGRHTDLWVKYALTRYAGRETVSSGLNEIPGNRKSDLRVQLRLNF